jgi:uncharacterized protein (TIGR03437 family)
MKHAIVFFAAAILTAAGSVNYSYDSAGRLIKVDYGNGSVVNYTYDKAGNLLSRSSTGTSSGGPVITSVITAYGGTDIAQNTWIVIKGTNLVPATTPATGVIWDSAPEFASGNLPTVLQGIGVTVNNKPAFVYFYCSALTNPACSSDQINALTPLDSTIGQAPVVVTNGTTASAPFSANEKAIAPSFLLVSTDGYIVATHTDYSLIGPTSLFPGATTPAKVNETFAAYAVGFGLPNGALSNGSASQSGSLPALPVCKIGSNNAGVAFAGLVSPGLYQINITVPAGTSSGDNPITCTYNGSSTPSGDLITVQ